MSERRWKIWVCPNCGRRMGGSYFCRCVTPASRCRVVEVIPADHPAVLSPEEARLLGAFHDTLSVFDLEANNAIRKRLRDYAKEEGQ